MAYQWSTLSLEPSAGRISSPHSPASRERKSLIRLKRQAHLAQPLRWAGIDEAFQGCPARFPFLRQLRFRTLIEKLIGLLDQLRGFGREVKLGKVFAPHPTRVHHIRRRRQASAHSTAGVIHNDEMVANTTGVFPAAHDAIEYRQDFQRFDVEAGLFLELAPRRLRQFFAELDQPAGNRPLALQRFALAANQQDSISVDHNAPHANQGTTGEFAFHAGHSRFLDWNGLPENASRIVIPENMEKEYVFASAV